mgnify:CR=1 FL=1
MGLTLTEKILSAHLVEGEMVKGTEIGIRIDQTLTQDATGTMAYLEFEAMGVPRVKTERSVAYIDHNTLQNGFMNMDDHRFIGSVAKKHGIYFSRPGNGICHQVHLERFGIPGKTLIGSDSHTPTGGGIGMIAIGAGGMDVAVAMGGGTYYITCPKIVKVELTGKLQPWVAAKDVILEVLRRLSVKGGVGKVIEYCGEGVKTLSVPERATITNMGAELGATTSIFPSDEITLEFLKAQGREEVYTPLAADDDAEYDEVVKVNLSELVPMAACPHSPDNVKTVEEIGPMKIDQVCIGSCTNSSLMDMLKVAYILKGKTVHPDVSLSIAPGSKQVLSMLAENGALADMLEAAEALSEAAKTDGYKAAVESLSRAFNLAEKADASVAVDASLFENDQEKALSKAIEELELTGSAGDKLSQLFALSPVIDAFFDNTMVMAEDEAVKNNRLALLSGLVAKAKAVAAFNQLNTK